MAVQEIARVDYQSIQLLIASPLDKVDHFSFGVGLEYLQFDSLLAGKLVEAVLDLVKGTSR